MKQLLVIVGACALWACSGKTSADKPDAGTDAGAADVSVDADAGAGDVEAPDGDAGTTSELPGGDDGAGADAEVEVDAGTAPACTTDADCAGKLNLTFCQEGKCDGGVCKAVKKPDTCCADADCDDKAECTTDKCNLEAHTCSHAPVVNCCSGKVTLAKLGFEQVVPGDELKETAAATNGNVKWQLSTHRAHGGKQSLYLGNECRTYDTSATPDDGCAPTGKASPVSSVLTSKELALPKDKKVHLHFWLWLDAEPPLVPGTLAAGSCTTPCAVGNTCVQFGGSSQCLPEKDVLTVQALAGDKVVPLFNSTTIGKTTAGQWQHVAIDLSPWAGVGIKLQWQFNTGTGLNNAHEGVYLDDVVVETICAQGGALCDDKVACEDDGNACSQNSCTGYVNGGTSKLGVCFYDKPAGCCTGNSDCDDGNDCTVDSCANGQCQNAPDASKPACCKPSLVNQDDFDDGTLDKWTPVGSNSAAVKWRIDPKGGVDGKAAAYFGTEALEGYDDPSLLPLGAKGLICTPLVTLKQGTLYNLLTFDLKLETEWSGLPKESYKNPPVAGKPKFDLFSVVVQSGGQLTPVWTSDVVYGTTGGKFVPVGVTLDAWQGKPVQVCFAFDAGDATQNAAGGVWLDNVVLKAACSKKACYFDGECAGLTCNACGTPACTATGCGCNLAPDCCTSAQDCDDNDPCTLDDCGADNKCTHAPSPSDPCNP
jgi:hypothetical protein